MSRRSNGHIRCARCRMHESLCFCAQIPRIATTTRLLLVIHHTEDRKSTNTGRLATECLENSEIVHRGVEMQPNLPLPIPPGTQPILLFPHEDAVQLSEFARDGRPVTLIVPDGNWRQAAKVRARTPGLREIPCVTLAHDAPSRYRLRSEAHPHGLATIEAIARAFGILESLEVRAALEGVLQTMVDRTLWVRGEVPTAEVRGGIPQGVMRHEPRTAERIAAQATAALDLRGPRD